MDRQVMETDIVVTGFGPAAAGFLLTLAPELAKTKEDGTPLYESKVMPGMPLQVMCYERADRGREACQVLAGVWTRVARHARRRDIGRDVLPRVLLRAVQHPDRLDADNALGLPHCRGR